MKINSGSTIGTSVGVPVAQYKRESAVTAHFVLGILVAGGTCFIYKDCGFAGIDSNFEVRIGTIINFIVPAITGCCNLFENVHENEDFFGGRLSSVEFFNLETQTRTQLGNMKHTRGQIGLAVINNRVTSFSSLVYNVTQDSYWYYGVETETVPMFYEELGDKNQWRNVSYTTTTEFDSFLTFPISDSFPGYSDQCYL